MIWYKSNKKHTKRQLKSNNKIYKVLKSKIYKVLKANNKILKCNDKIYKVSKSNNKVLKNNNKIHSMTFMHLCKTNRAQPRSQLRPTDIHKWPSVIMPFIKINSAAIISGSPLLYTSLRWPMRHRQMIGMLHAALKLLSWFFRWPTQLILYD